MEVDALWGLLAYVGAAASRTEDRSFVRWHVVSKLFSASVLAGIPNEIDACNLPPPSEAQLLACEKEIGFLTKLLSRGSMNDLPSSDSMVINLIRRSLTLQGDDYFGNADSRARCYPILHDRKSEKKLVSRLWKATHPLFFIDAASVECDLCSVFDIEFPDSVMEGMPFKLQSLLVPSSKVLRQCLGLLPAWIQRVSEKKVRQTRLLKSLNSLTTSLVEQATKAEDQISVHSNDSNSFANAFAVMLPVDSGNRFERKSIFLREAAALLKTVAILSKRASGRNTEPSKTSILSAGDVSQVSGGKMLLGFTGFE